MDWNKCNSACVGGSSANDFAYIQNSYGLETTYNYGRYLGYKSSCRAYSSLGLAKITGCYYPGTN